MISHKLSHINKKYPCSVLSLFIVLLSGITELPLYKIIHFKMINDKTKLVMTKQKHETGRVGAMLACSIEDREVLHYPYVNFHGHKK